MRATASEPASLTASGRSSGPDLPVGSRMSAARNIYTRASEHHDQAGKQSPPGRGGRPAVTRHFGDEQVHLPFMRSIATRRLRRNSLM
jgi:hypothetical protein